MNEQISAKEWLAQNGERIIRESKAVTGTEGFLNISEVIAAMEGYASTREVEIPTDEEIWETLEQHDSTTAQLTFGIEAFKQGWSRKLKTKQPVHFNQFKQPISNPKESSDFHYRNKPENKAKLLAVILFWAAIFYAAALIINHYPN